MKESRDQEEKNNTTWSSHCQILHCLAREAKGRGKREVAEVEQLRIHCRGRAVEDLVILP
jgi:hypothetical protein